MKKRSYIPLIAEITVKRSRVYDCQMNLDSCLYRFIKTRYMQPVVCINCLRELGYEKQWGVYDISKYTKYNKI